MWCDLAADLAEDVGDHHRAATILLTAGRRALASGSLSTAETVLERARTHVPKTRDTFGAGG